MSDRSRWREFRRGLAATAPFLLSHHEAEEYDRCYTLSPRVRLCARCSGVYPGIALGVVLAWWRLWPVSPLVLTALFPLPALLDWALTATGTRRGYNVVRTLTGALLGTGYGIGLVELLGRGNLAILGVGVGYVLLTLALVAWVRPWEGAKR